MTRAKRLTQAASRFRRFTGMEPQGYETRQYEVPDTALLVGDCLGIMYSTVRDGKRENYVHRFRRDSRPQLAVSHDGKTLVLLGGAFQFTDRGIVDRRKR